MKTLKILYAIIIYLPLLLVGCKNHDLSSNPILESDNSNILSIADTIEHWPLGNKVLKFGLIENVTNNLYEYTSTTIDSNGVFSISLNQVVPTNLISVVQIQNLPTSLITISNPDVRGALGELLIFNPDSSQPSWMAACISKILKDSVGYFTLDYMYVEKAMDVTGVFVGGAESGGKNYATTFEYKLHYKKGWNKIVVTLTERTELGNNITEKYLFTNSENSQSKWFVWFIGK